MTAAWHPPLFGNGLDGGALWTAVIEAQDRPFGGPDWPAALRYGIADAPGPDEWCAKVAVAGRAVPLLVVLRDFPFRAMFDVDLSVGDLGALPEALRGAVQEGVRATILSLLPPGAASALSIAEEGPVRMLAPQTPPDVEWMIARLEPPNGFLVDLLLGWPRALIAEFATRHVVSGSPVAAPLSEHLLVPAHMTLGAITLAAAEIGALEAGAVVVLAEGEGETLKVRVGELVFAFTDTGEGWACSGPQPLNRHRPRAALFRQGDTAMDDEAGNGAATGAENEPPMALGDLRIAVDFDLGRSMVPLATVASWQPGQVIDLALPTLSDGVEVTIRANGDVVGHGDLVRIDDRIAVRITRFLLRS